YSTMPNRLSVLPSLSSPDLSTFFFQSPAHHRFLHSFPTRRSSDLFSRLSIFSNIEMNWRIVAGMIHVLHAQMVGSTCIMPATIRSEEHTSELQSLRHLVCRLLLEKKKENKCYDNSDRNILTELRPL